MNSDRPLVPGPWPSGRASTRWTMFSGTSQSPLVMKRLTPSMCQVPSACWCATVRPAPTSEPASGSEDHRGAPLAVDHRLREGLLLRGAEAVDHGGEIGAGHVHE